MRTLGSTSSLIKEGIATTGLSWEQLQSYVSGLSSERDKQFQMSWFVEKPKETPIPWWGIALAASAVVGMFWVLGRKA